MRQICCRCGILYGIKEPIEDDSETHGLCEECFPLEMKKIEGELASVDSLLTGSPTKGQRPPNGNAE
jgi:hypothetical protein